MRDFIKCIFITAFLLSVINVAADNAIKQSFHSGFAGYGYSENPVLSDDGWTYVNLIMESMPANCFNGNTVTIQSGYKSVESQPEGYITSPKKQGGVGVVYFWYKARSVSYSMNFYELEVQTSSDGQEFTTVENGVISLSAKNAVDYQLASVIINDPIATSVRLKLRKQEEDYSNINIDEIIITDAVTGGSPSVVNVSADIEGELNEKTDVTILVAGNHIKDDLTFTFKIGSSFKLADEKVVVPADQFTDNSYQLPVSFEPKQIYLSTDTLCISGSGIPEILFPVDGLALERTVGENFNSSELPTWSNTVNYKGWQIVDGYRTTTAASIYEGEGSLVFYSSLATPRKLGGVGEVSFMYRAEQADKEIECVLYTSIDGDRWKERERFTVTDIEYKSYLKEIHDDEANYVKLVNTAGNSTHNLIVDLFIVSASGHSVSFLSADNLVFDTVETPYTFTVPLSFTNITGEMYVKVDHDDFSLQQSSIPFSQANGVYDLKITYSPEIEVAYTSCQLTVTGGGLYFPMVFPVSVYKENDVLYADFDGEWGDYSTGNYITDMGWSIVNGTRNSYNTLGGSAGCVALQNDGAIISPPKSGGVGSIQFYTNLTSTGITATVTILVSKDGTNWQEKKSIDCTNSGYEVNEVEINDPEAKFVKLHLTVSNSYTSIYIDNVLITADGVGIPKIVQEEEVLFSTQSGVEQSVNFPLRIENITSDIAVRLNSGNAFSLTNAIISPADVEDGVYPLSVTFKPETDGYFTDSLIFSTSDLMSDVVIPLKGYIAYSRLYQDFSGSLVSLGNNNYLLNGWEVFMGNLTTNPTDVLTGSSSLVLNTNSSGGGSLLSIPKSDGVGMISFYCKTSSSTPIEVKVLTYNSLFGSPVEAGVFEITSTPGYMLKEFVVNSPDAKYVKIELASQSNYGSIMIDNLLVTANGEVAPGITAPENVLIVNYLQEATEQTIELNIREIESEIRFSFLNGTKFELEPYKVNPGEYEGKINLTVTCLLNEDLYCADTLVIESNDLLIPIYVNLEGHVLQDKLYQDFNKEGWLSSEGTAIVDGWLMKTAMRQDKSQGNPAYVKEGEGAVRLTVSGSKNGSLRSPAKSGGVNSIAFYYLSTIMLDFEVQVSEDGKEWDTVDKVTTSSSPMSSYDLYKKEIKDREAKFVRIQTAIQSGATRELYLYVDSVAIDANSYIRLVEENIPQEITELPAMLELEVAGYLEKEVALSMLEDNSFFTIKNPVINPEELEAGKTRTIQLEINSIPVGGEYNDAIVVNGEGLDDPIYLPVYIVYTPNIVEPGDEVTIIECDFENAADIVDWKQYDLDGRTLFFYTGQPEGWFRIEDIEGNTVFGASSTFVDGGPQLSYKADDWLFTLPLEIPTEGSYMVSWDARSLHADYLEDYEIRVIEADLLQEFEDRFDETFSLAEVSSILVDNSDLLLSVTEESNDWITRSVRLNKYKGKKIRVIWRYTSHNMHTIYVDNFRYYSTLVGVDFEELPELTYRQIPTFAIGDLLQSTVNVSVTNGVDQELNNIQFNVGIYSPKDELLFSYTPDLNSLSAYEKYEVGIDKTELEKIADKDRYYQLEVITEGGYSQSLRSDMYNGVVVTDTIYAWDNGIVEGGVYSDSRGFRVGQYYPISIDSYLNSVTFDLTANTTATTVNLHIYELKEKVKTLLTSVNSIKVNPGKAASYVVELPGENLLLEAGNIYFVAVEQKDGEYLYLAKQEGYQKMAAYYTAANVEWIELDKEHTLFIRLNAYKEKKIIDSIENPNTENVRVELTKDGYLEIEGIVPGTLVNLYNVEGQLIFNAISQDDIERYPLAISKGVYIVKIGEQSYKVAK